MNVVLIFINQLFCKDEYEIFQIYNIKMNVGGNNKNVNFWTIGC